jgi:hypothetical protein
MRLISCSLPLKCFKKEWASPDSPVFIAWLARIPQPTELSPYQERVARLGTGGDRSGILPQ